MLSPWQVSKVPLGLRVRSWLRFVSGEERRGLMPAIAIRLANPQSSILFCPSMALMSVMSCEASRQPKYLPADDRRA